jgi:hypothetical protein
MTDLKGNILTYIENAIVLCVFLYQCITGNLGTVETDHPIIQFQRHSKHPLSIIQKSRLFVKVKQVEM